MSYEIYDMIMGSIRKGMRSVKISFWWFGIWGVCFFICFVCWGRVFFGCSFVVDFFDFRSLYCFFLCGNSLLFLLVFIVLGSLFNFWYGIWFCYFYCGWCFFNGFIWMMLFIGFMDGGVIMFLGILCIVCI